jgi:alpha-beta hydrolase superfamily lysophospholipase
MRKSIRFCLLGLTLLLVACAAPRTAPLGDRPGTPELTSRHFVTDDGLALPARHWPTAKPPRAIILGLHGFNDYAGAFRDIAPVFTAAGIAVYAYDQRGFGGSPHKGLWPGGERLQNDALAFAKALRAHSPETPLYLLGLSMGGAVALTALADAPEIADGAILVGPAVRGRQSIPAWQRWSLDALAHTIPGYRATGGGLAIQPTDNISVLRRMGKDPKVIKATRIDSLYGLVSLMSAAQTSVAKQLTPLLLMYGLKDDLVPKTPTIKALSALPAPAAGSPPHKIAVYEDGRHMLLRDLKRARVIEDIITWITNPIAKLPSGADQNPIERLKAAAH